MYNIVRNLPLIKVDINVLLNGCYYTTQLSSKKVIYNIVKYIQSFVQIIQHFQLLQLWRVLQEKVGQCQGLEALSSVHSAH